MALVTAMALGLPAVAQNNIISGTVFEDENFDGVRDPGEAGRGAIMVLLYRDMNQNGELDGGDILIDSVMSMPDGTFSFSKPYATNTVTSQVTISADDAEERISNGVVSLNSTDLEMIADGSVNQYVGMRFPNMVIDQGTPLSSAYIDFVVDEVQTTSTSLTFRGQAADNAPVFTTTAYDISSRPLTTASVSWNSIPWWTTVGEVKTSPDIKTIMQEIVDRSGWASGNAMVIRVNGSGRRTAVAQNLSTGGAPVLRLNYPTGTDDYFIIEFQEASIAPESPASTPYARAMAFTGTGQSSTDNDFGYLGLESSCFASADNGNRLHMSNRYTGSNQQIGSFGVPNIEALALNLDRDTLWAANANQLGTVNMMTGAFTALSQTFGTASGSLGNIAINDVDGLSFDPVSGTLWGTHRRNGALDLIVKINRNTGAHIPDAFGAGVGYVVLNGTGMLPDLDDIAVNPTSGQLYATNNDGGGLTNLITINPATGEGTVIVSLGMDDVEGQGFSNDGNFYAVTGDQAGGSDNNSFWKISITTGALTKLSTFNSDGDFEGCDCLTGRSRNIITGMVFNDVNEDSTYNAGDVAYAGATVYLYHDINQNDMVDGGDTLVETRVTNAVGRYVFITYVPFKYALTLDFATLPESVSMTTDSLETAPFSGMGQVDINNDFGYSTGFVMPVRSLTLDARLVENHVELKWVASSEFNTSHYEIQRSTDGIHGHAIMQQSATGEKHCAPCGYQATDHEPLDGASFYRVKQVSYEGQAEYSAWKRIESRLVISTMVASPNPARDGTVRLTHSPTNASSEFMLRLVDVCGLPIAIDITEVSAGECCVYNLDIGPLAPGTYYILGTSGNTSHAEALVVQ